MNGRSLLVVAVALAALLCGGCGFHLRGEARLPPGMQRVHVEIADHFGPLARDLERALRRSGAQVVDSVEPGVAVMRFTVNSIGTDVQSVGGNARANEYVIRYHVEFDVEDAAGTLLLPKQVIELSRDFTFDASQALGIAAEQDVLTEELERDMVQTILRRLEALAKAPH
ncbi:MAG: LPS assembly lipoprotein LptE [Rhodanobacteraceae bacterium]